MSDLNLVTQIKGVSSGLKVEIAGRPQNAEQIQLRVDWFARQVGAAKLAIGTKIQIQGSPDDALSGVISGLTTPVAGDGAVIPAGLTEGSTPADGKVAFGAFPFRIGGVNKVKAADAAGVAFDDVHKVTASKFGAIAINIKADGTIETQINSAAQDDTLSFDDAEAALLNIQHPDFLPPTDFIRIGYILIANDAGLWTANTDDLTDGGDVTTATFIDITSSYREIDEWILNADEIQRGKGTIHLGALRKNNYIRLFASEIIGDVELTLEANFIPISLG